MEDTYTFSDDISVVLGGEAGQGLQTIERVMSSVLNKEGYRVFSFSEYMSRVRGGSNSTQIRVTNERREAFVERMDLFFPLHKSSLEHCQWRIGNETVVFGDKTYLGDKADGYDVIDVPFMKAAEEVGGKIFLNTIVAGFILALFDIKADIVEDFITKAFAKKGESIVKKNVMAIQKGQKMGSGLQKKLKLKIQIEKHPEKEHDLFMTGNDAVSLGAVAGGCNFISSYPMTPGTGVINGIAALSKEFDIVVEQAEDEISAINMGLGAWYAGARAIVSTSGGGFALMTESVSLAGIMESPMVIHIAQRPGPATGYPTRTEQGDLNFVLHSGHGEFPRVILAPGTIEDGYNIGRRAFEIAARFQVPVFILTDQFYVDSHMCANSDAMPVEEVEYHIVETEKGYKRYAYVDDGKTPRGIPGWGEGFVCADSDEHEEEGRITESHETRVKMMDKRMSRFDLLRGGEVDPEFIGSDDAKTLVIGWGSTYGVIKETLEGLGRDDVQFVHAKQVFPLPEQFIERLKKNVDTLIVIENNFSGQFADLIELKTGKKIDHRILQYDGLPFSVERLTKELEEIL